MTSSDPFAGVPGPLRKALERRGFASLTAVQQAVVASDSQGRDLRISSETGSGKTVAIGLALARSLLDRGGPKPASTPAAKPNDDAGSTAAKPADDAKPIEGAGSTDAKPADDAKPNDAKPASDAKPSDAKPNDDAKPSDAKPNDDRTPADDSKPADDAKPNDAKPNDAKPNAAKPNDAKPDAARARSTKAGPKGPLALVITPTRELAVQVRDELRWLLAELPKMRVEVVTGGTDLGGERRMLRRAPVVLVGTPGRLLDHIRAGAVPCGDIADVVLDEADRMLDMGFRDELEAIIDSLPKQRRSHLVSATFSGVMRGVADRFQRNALHLQGTALGQANTDIDHVAQLVAHHERYAALVNALLLARGQQVLVFVERRDGASDLAEQLAGDGFAALPFSGDLSQAQRTRTLHAFRNETIQVLVSTDVAARGIDVPQISMVVHMSPPSDPDGYTHRSGRTGRAGRRGRSLLLVPPRARHYVTRLLAAAKIDVEWQAVPTPNKVRRALTKQTRKRLHVRLGDAEDQPADKTLEYARLLLAERDPVNVVATLLELAEPVLPRQPMVVEAIPLPQPGAPDPEPDRRNRPRRGPPRRPLTGRRRRTRRPPSGS